MCILSFMSSTCLYIAELSLRGGSKSWHCHDGSGNLRRRRVVKKVHGEDERQRYLEDFAKAA